MPLIATVEETGATGPGSVPSLARILRSDDDGLSWYEMVPTRDFDSLTFSKLLGASNGVGYFGSLGPITGSDPLDMGPFSVVARTTTAGKVWTTTALPEDWPYPLDGTSWWDIRRFADFGNGVILAGGSYNVGPGTDLGDMGYLLRSTDGGVTFRPLQPPSFLRHEFYYSVLAMCSLGGGVGLVAVEHENVDTHQTGDQLGLVLRTEDYGDTWEDASVPPDPNWRRCVNDIVYLGSGRVVAGGWHTSLLPAADKPAIWISVDHGRSWS